MDKKVKNETQAETLNFEEAFKKLQETVKKLEQGDLPLENALRFFEEGVSLTRTCQSELTSAEQKVEQLIKITNDDKAVTKPFNG